MMTSTRIRRGIQLLWLIAPLLACNAGAPESAATAENSRSTETPPQAAAAVSDDRPVIIFIGTSLTAGLGVDPSEAYPALIQEKIDSAGLGFRVVNAGVSGETSAGALRRVDWLFSQTTPAVVVVETGANDGLRGQSPDSLRSNLEAIIRATEQLEPRPRIFIAAMEALPNLGREYGQAFRSVFADVANRHGAILIPFFLDGVAGVDSLNQADGIHPNPRGARRAAENVWKVLGPELGG